MDRTEVIIIGGGISGITTGVTLQLLGLDTEIYTHKLATDPDQDDPRFASLYPAASILPHSVGTDKMDRLFDRSLEIFRLLHRYNARGMQQHRHYEVFEFPPEQPGYLGYMDDVEKIDPGNDPFIPRRNKDAEIDGWVFNCYVAEWPMYIRELYRWYRSAGGRITQKKLSEDDLSGLPSGFVINCSGMWAPQLFGLKEPAYLLRGHLLHIRDMPIFRNGDGLIPSYNYIPEASAYADPDGSPTDLYFYPRSNGWVLGGSREPGILNDNGTWSGPEHDELIEIGGKQIPAAIWSLNREILAETFKFKLDTSYTLDAAVGYRYMGSNAGGKLRLEGVQYEDKQLFHNYGHGGSGVTLSWGCALEAAFWLKELKGGLGDLRAPRRPILKFLQHEINRIVYQDQPEN